MESYDSQADGSTHLITNNMVTKCICQLVVGELLCDIHSHYTNHRVAAKQEVVKHCDTNYKLGYAMGKGTNNTK